jgi:hypothetical protein
VGCVVLSISIFFPVFVIQVSLSLSSGSTHKLSSAISLKPRGWWVTRKQPSLASSVQAFFFFFSGPWEGAQEALSLASGFRGAGFLVSRLSPLSLSLSLFSKGFGSLDDFKKLWTELWEDLNKWASGISD